MRRFVYLGLSAAGLVLAACVVSADAAEIAHYRFDSNFNDSSGNANHGTPTGGSVTITNSPGEYVFGGGAVNFTAAREWVDIPTITFGSGNPYAVSFWARDTTAGTTGDGGMVIGQPNNTNFFIYLNSPSTDLRWRSADSTAARQADFSFSNVDTNWHHYVVMASDFDNDTSVDDITLYRDGVFVGNDQGNQTGFIFDAIGEAYTSSPLNLDFVGQIDEVRIFDQALTASEISNLFQFNSLTAVPEPSTIFLWVTFGMAAVVAKRWSRTGRTRSRN